MKITVTTESTRESIALAWQMPGEDPASLYLLPPELTPKGYPHIAQDCGRLATFWGNRLVMHHSIANLAIAPDQDGTCRTAADVIHCDTNRLLAVLRTLLERKIPRTVLDTARIPSRERVRPSYSGWARL